MDYIKSLPLPPPRCRSAPHQLPLATAVCILFACHLYLTGHVNKKSVLKSLAYSAILDLALYMSFTLAVRMSLPRGLLF